MPAGLAVDADAARGNRTSGNCRTVSRRPAEPGRGHARHRRGRPDRRLRQAAAAATPEFDRLAREGVLFEQAMTSAPLTLPAHARSSPASFRHSTASATTAASSSSPSRTLAELLDSARGSHRRLRRRLRPRLEMGPRSGIRPLRRRLRPVEGARRCRSAACRGRANEVVDLALPWLERVAGQRFFAWLHFYDPHAPYEPPEPFKTQYAASHTTARSPSSMRRSAEWSSSSRPRACSIHDRHRARRSRREPGRARRGHARLLHLRDRARTCRSSSARPSTPRRTAGGQPGAHRGPDADGARPARAAARGVAVGRRTQLAGADDRRPAATSRPRATPRRCIRCITTAGARSRRFALRAL